MQTQLACSAPDLAAFLIYKREALAQAWAELACRIPESHYCALPLDQAQTWMAHRLDAISMALAADAFGLLGTRLARVAQLQVLTSFATDDKVFPAVKAGAPGYLLKDCGPDALVQAIRQVARGESSLHPTIARKVLHELAHPSGHPPTPQPLTERELDVLRLLAAGLSNREIADRLAITERQVTKKGKSYGHSY